MKLIKTFSLLIVFIVFLLNPNSLFAQTDSSSFVSIVNPIRGEDFWDLQDQKPQDVFLGQMDILKKLRICATWLIRFDALNNQEIVGKLSNSSDEKGLFLEVTPKWANQANVNYHTSENWHAAGSAFLTGYEQNERIKLIDKAFERFRETFSYYPTSVGAWWIDSFSLDYMQKKYNITSVLVVADQYTTDNYQIWGQYFSTPYYPNKRNALQPAQTLEDKIPVVISQWAPRDPVNSYGNGVFESTFSVQANDYIDYHDLDISYFEKLVDIYTKQLFNKFGSIVVGLENTYKWNNYKDEYKRQVEVLSRKNNSGDLQVVTLKDFSSWYQKTFPNLSPEHIIVANDPLGSDKKVVWFMNPYYRVGWFYNTDGSVFRDIRQYAAGLEEICFKKRCDEVNFATFATRVLDEVTYGHKWVVDEGRVENFNVSKAEEKYIISYKNEAGNSRSIEFLARDIGVDGNTLSIDSRILAAVEQNVKESKKIEVNGIFEYSIFNAISKIAKFLLFLVFAILIPGYVLTNNLFEIGADSLKRLFVSVVVGFVSITVSFYIFSLLNFRLLIFIYPILCVLFLLRLKMVNLISFKFGEIKKYWNLLTILVIVTGTIFQVIPAFRSGLVFKYGMGLWGPNTHDGIWHLSLINQLIERLPVENPIFADTILKNYHFFFDLLVALTTFFTKVPAIDLLFRFYPAVFSFLLGLGTYYLVTSLFKSKLAAIFSLYFVYFAGSFGWIVDYLKHKSFGGESAFWANQSISFNLNPPFAVSLLILIAFLIIFLNKEKLKSVNGIFITTLLAGSMVGFKAYGAVLLLGSLFFISILKVIKKDLSYLLIFTLSSLISILIFLSNFKPSQQLMLFAPFWFIHAMVDSADRLGWVRLSLARVAGVETNNWFKFISAEVISFLIFILGNLGVRFLSLIFLLKIGRVIKDINMLFILIFSTASFLIPVLFIQSGNPWNTIQFLYYGLYTTALTAGVVLAYFVSKLSKVFTFILIISVLIITPINSITTASYYLGTPHAIVDKKELEALSFLSNQEQGTVLTYPYDKKLKQKMAEPWPLFVYDSTAYVSALSNKASYLEDESQNQILLNDYKKRLVSSRDFFLKSDKEFLQTNNIEYIYLLKIYNIRLNEQSLPIEKLFENEETILFKVKK